MLRLMLKLPNGDGATSIEYAMIGALISIVIIGACTAIGTSLSSLFFGPVASAL
jgi:pilus assembly protein Flp/PilA